MYVSFRWTLLVSFLMLATAVGMPYEILPDAPELNLPGQQQASGNTELGSKETDTKGTDTKPAETGSAATIETDVGYKRKPKPVVGFSIDEEGKGGQKITGEHDIYLHLHISYDKGGKPVVSVNQVEQSDTIPSSEDAGKYPVTAPPSIDEGKGSDVGSSTSGEGKNTVTESSSGDDDQDSDIGSSTGEEGENHDTEPPTETEDKGSEVEFSTEEEGVNTNPKPSSIDQDKDSNADSSTEKDSKELEISPALVDAINEIILDPQLSGEEGEDAMIARPMDTDSAESILVTSAAEEGEASEGPAATDAPSPTMTELIYIERTKCIDAKSHEGFNPYGFSGRWSLQYTAYDPAHPRTWSWTHLNVVASTASAIITKNDHSGAEYYSYDSATSVFTSNHGVSYTPLMAHTAGEGAFILLLECRQEGGATRNSALLLTHGGPVPQQLLDAVIEVASEYGFTRSTFKRVTA